MGRQVESLARFVAETRLEDIPPAVRGHAKLVLLDTFGVILAGAERPEVAALRARLAPMPSPGPGGTATVYAAGWTRSDPRNAALLNGIAGRSIELCEGLRLVSGQAALQILPAVLALGEARGRPGGEVLASLILGYEVAGRLATGFTPRPLAHQNGQVSLLAAAAAASRLHGLDGAGTSRAMRIAASLLLTPSYTNAVAGATALNVAGGMSGFAGVLAPDLALAGFAAEEDAVEQSLGQLVGAGFEPGHLADGLGAQWQITRNYFRLYACCNPIHPALDCLAAALAELRPGAGDVAAIEIATYRFASVMGNPAPPNYFASKYSLPHAAATMVVRGGAGYAELDDSALADPAIARLRALVHISEDPAMTRLAPLLRPARVTVKLKNGREATHSRQSHRGDFNEPFSDIELREKFRLLAGTVLPPDGVAAIEAAVDSCESWSSAAELPELLRRSGRR
jgi:2-methylcitrate dehydratase PrpD